MTAPAALAALLLAAAAPAAWGHGVGYELLPPVEYGGGWASLEVDASGYAEDGRVRLSLLDANTSEPLPGVSYALSASKGGEELFSGEFEGAGGALHLELSPGGGGVSVEHERRAGPVEALLGLQSSVVRASGPAFAEGGLYEFAVEARSGGAAAAFDAGLSIPHSTSHLADDPHFGARPLEVVTYYDLVSGFSYDPAAGGVSFSMPFEWSAENVGQTPAVHVEVVTDGSLGRLMASGYEGSVNGVPLPGPAVTGDDFSGDGRTIHVVVSQADLLAMLGGQEGGDAMEFEVRPAPGAGVSAVTADGRFRVHAEPWILRPGSEAAVEFGVYDTFLRDKPVEAEYELSVEIGGEEVHSQSGTSGAGGAEEARFLVPPGAAGPAALRLSGLGGGGAGAAAELLLAVGAAEGRAPAWVAGLAGWWAGGLVSDAEFAAAAGHLAASGAMGAPGAGGEWNAAARWAAGEASDAEFAAAAALLAGASRGGGGS